MLYQKFMQNTNVKKPQKKLLLIKKRTAIACDPFQKIIKF